MSRYRLEICKGAEVRYLSHLDFMRAFQRAVRRAGLPVALSEGFNPHPKISFGTALPVGVSSECELVDIELKKEMPDSELKNGLEKALPPGIKLNQVSRVDKQEVAVMAAICRSEYIVRVKPNPDYSITGLEMQNLLKKFLDSETVIVEKRSKKGIKEVNIRPGIFELTGQLEDDWIVLKMVLQTGSGGNIKPEDVLKGLAQFGLSVEQDLAVVHRTRLFCKE